MEIDDTALHSLCAQGASRPPSSGVTSDDTNRRVLLVRFLLYISCSPPPPYSPGAQNFIYEPTGPFSTMAHHPVLLASLLFPTALPEEAGQTHQARRPTARAILEAPDMHTTVTEFYLERLCPISWPRHHRRCCFFLGPEQRLRLESGRPDTDSYIHIPATATKR